MKKLFALLIISSFFINNCFSQEIEFRIQPDGSFLNYEDGKSYIVIDYPNYTSDELYTDILTSITRLYRSPKDIVSKVEGKIISLNGIKTNCISAKALGLTVLTSIEYNLKFQFKDGKIRIDAPFVWCFYKPSEKFTAKEWIDANSIFKNGVPNPKKRQTLNDLNNTLNGIISDIIYPENDNSSDEW